MMSGVVNLDFKGFVELVESGRLVVVDFWAPWCAPCLAMAPVFERVAEKFSGKAVFAKVNIEEEAELADALGIRAIPTIIVFKDGKVVDAWVGFMREEELTEMVERHLGEGL